MSLSEGDLTVSKELGEGSPNFGVYFKSNQENIQRRRLFLKTVSGQIAFNSNKLLQNSVRICANCVFSFHATKIS